MNINFQLAINAYLAGTEEGQHDDQVWVEWAVALDIHAWKVAKTFENILTATAELFNEHEVQYLLDTRDDIPPELLLSIFWLIRRDQLVLVPNLASALDGAPN